MTVGGVVAEWIWSETFEVVLLRLRARPSSSTPVTVESFWIRESSDTDVLGFGDGVERAVLCEAGPVGGSLRFTELVDENEGVGVVRRGGCARVGEGGSGWVVTEREALPANRCCMDCKE